MPSGNIHAITEVLETCIMGSPRTILEVGIGFGKYGMLLREYLEIYGYHDCYGIHAEGVRIEGVEPFSPYILPHHASFYDRIYQVPIEELIGNLEWHKHVQRIGGYDLILLADVIEHIPRPLADGVLKVLSSKGRIIVLTTPTSIETQGGVFGNEREAHVSQWTAEDFTQFGLVEVIREDEPVWNGMLTVRILTGTA